MRQGDPRSQIHHYISSPSYKIMSNDEKSKSFSPSRSIRQGDSFSLFITLLIKSIKDRKQQCLSLAGRLSLDNLLALFCITIYNMQRFPRPFVMR